MKLTLKHNVLAVALFAFYSTTSSAATVCRSADSDPDGDGWGWENNSSCMVTSESAAGSADGSASASAVDSNSSAICSLASSDEDGDGWGWENNRSCVVASASASTTAPANDVEIESVSEVISGPAQCASALSDPDGDGWGWENNQSCIVAAGATDNIQPDATPEITEPEAPQIPVVAEPVVVQQEPVILPPCSIPALDDDNDGTGRENNQDCTVETPVNVRIMALGDSITHGTRNESAESYREPFTGLMTSSACQFEMVGSQTGNHFHNTFVSPHEGYNGHTADNILNGRVDNAGNNEGISVTANRYQPHVVLLHIGSNDMKLGQDFDQTVGEIDQIISIILATESAPVVLLANVIPWPGDATINANVKVLGDRIEAYVAQLNDPRVRIVDVRTGFENSMILNDGVHPNPAGEQYIAERFFEAYDSAGFCR